MNDEELLARARALAEAELAALDADTLRRLQAARRAALAQRRSPARWRRSAWVPVGAAAAVAVVAVGVALGTRSPAPGVVEPPVELVAEDAVGELELLLGAEELALYDEDPEFYEWLDHAR